MRPVEQQMEKNYQANYESETNGVYQVRPGTLPSNTEEAPSPQTNQTKVVTLSRTKSNINLPQQTGTINNAQLGGETRKTTIRNFRPTDVKYVLNIGKAKQKKIFYKKMLSSRPITPVHLDNINPTWKLNPRSLTNLDKNSRNQTHQCLTSFSRKNNIIISDHTPRSN